MLSTFCFLSFSLIKHLLITYFLYAAIYEKIMKPILNTCKNTALGDECMCQRNDQIHQTLFNYVGYENI